MFCSVPTSHMEGDSNYIVSAIMGVPPAKVDDMPYFKGVSNADILAYPIQSVETMAKFPPSLLIASTRDFLWSPVIYTHTLLVHLGVEAELHMWEGLGHGFFVDLDMPESRQAYDVIVKFFDKYLSNRYVERARKNIDFGSYLSVIVIGARIYPKPSIFIKSEERGRPLSK